MIRALWLSFICLHLPALAQEVSVDLAGPEIFPKSWLTPAVNAQATLLEPHLREPSRTLLQQALAKYPQAVLQTHLKHVYVIGRLSYSGVPTGGTNSRNEVYLANTGTASEPVLEGIFHAEFSSILLRNLPQNLDQKRWHEINPPGFHYLGSGVQAIKQGKASRKPDPALQALGFMHSYAQASPEEDFNSIASRLMMGDAALWGAMQQFPKMREKAELVIAFYTKLHPEFTRERFEAFRAR